MKTAFAVWNKRIAPVFDVSRRVIMIESKAAGKDAQIPVMLTSNQPLEKVQQLSEMGAESLVCGAISRALQAALTARGIRVIAYVAGDAQDIIDAWRQQNFEAQAYAMPGGRNRHWLLTYDQKEEGVMPKNRGGGGRRMGGRGLGGQRGCRQTSQASEGAITATSEMCVCTQCGYGEVHEPGNPCVHKKCPQCGANMSRK